MIFQDVRNLFALIEATLMKEDKEDKKCFVIYRCLYIYIYINEEFLSIGKILEHEDDIYMLLWFEMIKC